MSRKLWGRKNSSNVQKARWALEEAGIAYEQIDAGGPFGGLDTPAYRAMNPNGYVPTYEEDGFILWESHAITRYVAETHASGALFPQDPHTRALANQWMDWMLANLNRSFLDLFWSYWRTPEAQRDMKRIARLEREVARHMGILEAQLEGRSYLLGETLTMADIPAGTMLYRYYEMPIERADLPNLAGWYARLKERAAYREAVMVPFDDLYGRLAF